MVAKAVALDGICQAFVDRSQEQFDQLDPEDQKRVHRWLPVAHRRIGLRHYKSSKAWLDAATKELRPKAVDWQKVLDFLKGLMPLVQVLIALFTKA